jgi:N-acetylmuramoyl-L-alanine amidase
MPEDYTVEPGDCMSSIAYENGFFWQTLWNDPSNADLKIKRKDPNVLMTGDVVHIPDLTVRNEPGATEMTHTFVLKGVPEVLRMRLQDELHKPRPNLDYVIVIEGISRRGKTDANGELKESIPPNARNGTLTFAALRSTNKAGKPVPGRPKTQVMILQLGNLNPISEVSGLKARLANLKFYKGQVDENLDDATKLAIRKFQTKQGLPVTGIADDATKAQLKKLHGK